MQKIKDSGNKTIIITGGNSGLGYECAKNIAKTNKDTYIVLACRNSDKTISAVKSLINTTGNHNISNLEIDLSSLESVRKFVKTFTDSKYPPLYAIVCNAATQIVNGTRYTEDGFELTFGVNHLGHFLLVNMLLEIIDNGRVVFVSSDTHDPAKNTGMPEPVYNKAELLAYPNRSKIILSGTARYTTSKLCNIYCAYELAERIKSQTSKNITVNAFDPGMMPGTELARDYNPFLRFVWKHIMPVLILFRRNVNTVEKSGRALTSLIVNVQFDKVSGKYFQGTREIASSKLSYNFENRNDLWRTSIDLVQLQQNETIISII
ncbi:MAG: SDR family NAD(P)-dependent oxidoreductase [Candidatus Xenobiia bacterium LiM19]